ncbi:DUF3021 domain-containing protein [Peribacillus butanolivorans]|uniref:DUF3021 domain-containing protein n=1 Tax=Peribacillus butanolivorans TaxID=421767 RepID=UPI00366B75DE
MKIQVEIDEEVQAIEVLIRNHEWNEEVQELMERLKERKRPYFVGRKEDMQHFLYFLLSFFVGWIPFSLKGLVTGIGIFLPFYVIIWIIFYLYFRHQVKILNDGLDKRGN